MVHLTNREISFFVLLFSLLYCIGSSILFAIGAICFVSFLLKRKEIYFVWCFVAPRITGYAPFIDYMLSIAREEGPGNKELTDLLRIDLPFASTPIFFIFHPSYLKRVLSTEANNFASRGHEGAIAKMTFGKGEQNIFISEGPCSPHWAKFRELTSAINKDRFGANSTLAQLFGSTWKTTQEFARAYESKRGISLDLFMELYRIMVPAHNYALFGEEFAKKYSYNGIAEEVHDVLNEVGKQLKFPYATAKQESTLARQLKRIADATKNMASETTSPFIANFVQANKKGLLSDDELYSNLLVFEYAHAPLPVVFWALYLLALHPDEERKVVHEIAEVLSKGPMTYARLGEFKYLARVVTETMRLYPSVGVMQARFPKTNTMFGNHFVPQDSFVLMCQYVINRNASAWTDPDVFNPMREGLDTTHSGDTFKHFPFGYGPRQCQGQYFAQDFVKVTIISLLQHHRIEVVPGQAAAVPTENVFLRPNYPVYFSFSPRILPRVESHDEPEEEKVEEKKPEENKPQKKPPQFLSRSKTNVLVSQSSIFKDSLISVGKQRSSEEKNMLILYASQAGHAYSFATRLVRMATLCKMPVDLLSMNELDTAQLAKYKTVLVATSTFGDGGPPENGQLFNSWLEKETSTTLLKGVNFAVLSLGSSMYPYPFKFGKFVSRKFVQLGATRILADKHLDEIRYNQQEEFTAFSVAVFDAIAAKTQGGAEAKNLVARNKLLGFQNFDFNLIDAPFRLNFTERRLKLEPRGQYADSTVLATVKSNVLVSEHPNNKIYRLDLQYQNGATAYQAGDNVAVYAPNEASSVQKLLARLQLPSDLVFNIEQDIGTSNLTCSLGKNKCTPEIALTYFYDIETSPTTGLLQFFAMNSDSEKDQNTLSSYVANYRSFLFQDLSPLNVLENFPSVQPFKDQKKLNENLAIFLGLLGPLHPRYYSIASAPETNANHLCIVYKAVQYTNKHGKHKRGLCSTYLQSSNVGDKVAISVAKSRFRLPEDSKTPIIMVGAGSGISPYFSFVEERTRVKANGGQVGKAVLIHGCRDARDFADKPKIDFAVSSNLISDLWPAYSKAEGVPSEHVQEVIARQGAILWELIQNENATIFICGDIKVGNSVRDAFMKLARTHGNMKLFQANAWVSSMAAKGRIRHDEWGVGTTNAESVIRAARLRLWRKSIHVALIAERST